MLLSHKILIKIIQKAYQVIKVKICCCGLNVSKFWNLKFSQKSVKFNFLGLLEFIEQTMKYVYDYLEKSR